MSTPAPLAAAGWRESTAVEATVLAGVGLLSTLDALEDSSAYYYLSRDMDYLCLVGLLLREHLPGSGPPVRPLAVSRESMFDPDVRAYEAECGLAEGRPLVVDSGFHGNVIAAICGRWSRAEGRLIESHSLRWPSCRTSLSLAAVTEEDPVARKRWVEGTIEAAPRRTTKVTGYRSPSGRLQVRCELKAPAAAEEFEARLRAAFADLSAERLYGDVRELQETVVRAVRATGVTGSVLLDLATFADFRAVGPDRHHAYLVLALQDLCADLSWRGLARRLTVHARVPTDLRPWRSMAAGLRAETGVEVSVTTSAPAGARLVAAIDAEVHRDPQRAVSITVERLDRERVPRAAPAEAGAALRGQSWGPAFAADLLQTVQHRPGRWDSRAATSLLERAVAR